MFYLQFNPNLEGCILKFSPVSLKPWDLCIKTQHFICSKILWSTFHSWSPSGSLLLRKPPITKGLSSMKTILETHTHFGDTVRQLLSVLYKHTDVSFINRNKKTHPQAVFEWIKKNKVRFTDLDKVVHSQWSNWNSQLEVTYTFFSPTETEYNYLRRPVDALFYIYHLLSNS